MPYAPPAYQDTPAPTAPKSYQAVSHEPDSAGPSVSAPLLARASLDGGASVGSDDDDFKYGSTVSSSDVTVRHAFIKKVYSILSVQLLFTAIVSLIMVQPTVTGWVRENTWFMWIPLVTSFGSLGALFWKIDQHPVNLVILGVFTLAEAAAIGTVVSFYETAIVIQALFITLGVFIGLTAFTWQSKYEFDSLAPWLFAGLMVIFTTSMVSIFFPFSRTMDLVLALLGCLVFSGYILYDTHQIQKKLSPDEYIMGALRLYLDILNLFLQILRVLSNSQRD